MILFKKTKQRAIERKAHDMGRVAWGLTGQRLSGMGKAQAKAHLYNAQLQEESSADPHEIPLLEGLVDFVWSLDLPETLVTDDEMIEYCDFARVTYTNHTRKVYEDSIINKKWGF